MEDELVIAVTYPAPTTVSTSRAALWTGRVLNALTILMLAMDGVVKLVRPAPVVAATVQLGYPESTILGIGLVLLACTLLYAIPRTAILGAILLTGYLGGAVATHVRVGSAPFSLFFPVFIGALVWAGIYLREPRLRMLLPLHGSKVTMDA